MTRYACVDDQKAAGFPVNAAREAVGVSASGDDGRCDREAVGPTERQVGEADLVVLMREIFDDADGNYGVPHGQGAPQDRSRDQQEAGGPADAHPWHGGPSPAPDVPHHVPWPGRIHDPVEGRI